MWRFQQAVYPPKQLKATVRITYSHRKVAYIFLFKLIEDAKPGDTMSFLRIGTQGQQVQNKRITQNN